MRRLGVKRVTIVLAMALIASVALFSFAAVPALSQDSSPDFSHVVNLDRKGDSIRIVEVRGPSDTLAVGNTYEVRGTYKLASQDKALLMVNVTTEGQTRAHSNLPQQKMIVEKGEGSFVLQFHMWEEGMPHVSFYPVKGGSGFAARYF